MYAEKKALQQVSLKMIERSMSCESLMDLLLQEGEYHRISREQTALKQLKHWRRRMLKTRVGRDNVWMVSMAICFCAAFLIGKRCRELLMLTVWSCIILFTFIYTSLDLYI